MSIYTDLVSPVFNPNKAKFLTPGGWSVSYLLTAKLLFILLFLTPKIFISNPER